MESQQGRVGSQTKGLSRLARRGRRGTRSTDYVGRQRKRASAMKRTMSERRRSTNDSTDCNEKIQSIGGRPKEDAARSLVALHEVSPASSEVQYIWTFLWGFNKQVTMPVMVVVRLLVCLYDVDDADICD
ncbi:hypothetical protein H257_06830 [Aphanomyces astaci]|uniref:Uncharacterized protein n=1 Tax=Aphanomyces astaci TaxID=112090 RepID=W4GKN1_APHAT|nr:hypothetical protein H257_06830 [Aphanomyces astaci]ETV79569.1 hypothetical protein H257_06830 [Aphanomyces astaci]|eukprot:XP_009830505.1 hypothetical protein H257_06830 [Aphanomyces astaci]